MPRLRADLSAGSWRRLRRSLFLMLEAFFPPLCLVLWFAYERTGLVLVTSDSYSFGWGVGDAMMQSHMSTPQTVMAVEQSLLVMIGYRLQDSLPGNLRLVGASGTVLCLYSCSAPWQQQWLLIDMLGKC